MVLTKRRTLLLAMLAVMTSGLAAGCSFSLAEDIKPPSDYQQPVTTVAPAADVNGPEAYPDIMEGVAIYSERCAPCHGDQGLGNGPQAAQLPNPPTAFAELETSRQASPLNWYNVVSQGNLQKFMPPFANSLSEQQRWNVVAYILSMGISPDEMETGKEVYAAECQSCHGAGGKGDGPQAAGLNVPDWTQPGRFMDVSAQDLWETVSSGYGNMPSFADRLSEQERWAAVSYIRSLSLKVSPEGSERAEEDKNRASQSDSVFDVQGSIQNKSGGSVPDGMIVTLQGFDNLQPNVIKAKKAGQGGSYYFKDVEVLPGRVYLVSTKYNGSQFFSEFIQAADIKAGQELHLPVSIYDSTTDVSDLFVERMHIFLEFSTPDRLQVVELFIITNPGTRMVIPEKEGTPVLQFDIPAEAEDLQFQNGELGGRFVETPGGFGDTLSILPGMAQHQVLFSYSLPYTGKRNLSFSIPMRVSAALVAVPGEAGVHLTSDTLKDTGKRDVKGMTVQLFGANELPAGSTLNMMISGKMRSGTQFGGGSLQGTGIGLVIFLGALALAVSLIARSRTPAVENEASSKVTGPEDTESGLLDAIVALDDLYKEGRLPADAYEERRARLKERLRKLKGL